jgi:hypothetical protein
MSDHTRRVTVVWVQRFIVFTFGECGSPTILYLGAVLPDKQKQLTHM